MIPLNRTFAPLRAFADELVRCGMAHVVTSPGSRNAPLVLTLAERIPATSVLDERSAGFVALGMAKASGAPVAVTCTSGTAAANLAPAVAEAREAGVPLLVLTADRPPELRDVGAGQAIDQVKLFGAAAKWFAEVGNHEPGRASAVHHRALACRAYFTAGGGRPGPVHLNFPLREPLQPVEEEGLEPTDWEGRPGGAPWTVVEEELPSPTTLELPPRAVVVAGAGAPAEATGHGWPLFADAISGLRRPSPGVICHYDVLLRDEPERPDLVVRFGEMPTSRPLREWAGAAEQIVVDPYASWHDPTRRASSLIPVATLQGTPDPGWLARWRAADARVPGALAAASDPFEPKFHVAAAHGLTWIASSMPIREIEAFMPASETRFLSNRGANGIDGTVSSALGVALTSGEQVRVLTGELALLHDFGGLLAAKRHGFPLTILAINNGGGGIFEFLPLAEHADAAMFEEHIVTPAGVDLEKVAALLEVPYLLTQTPGELAEGGITEVRTDRADSVRLHRELYERLRAR